MRVSETISKGEYNSIKDSGTGRLNFIYKNYIFIRVNWIEQRGFRTELFICIKTIFFL